MLDSNTYKGSTRDHLKRITCNGKTINGLKRVDWGWYGADTCWSAILILCNEYGPKTAIQYYKRFAREVLATYPEEGFVLTSGVINFYIKKFDK